MTQTIGFTGTPWRTDMEDIKMARRYGTRRGDCRAVMPTFPEASIDSIVTDPPYGLEFMGKGWDTFGRGEAASGATAGMSKPGIGQREREWPSYLGGLNPRCTSCGHSQRGGSPCRCDRPSFTDERGPRLRAFQEWTYQWAVEAFRVLKPGGYLLAFGGPRTFHRLAVAIEDAGFEIRDCLMWLYGSGFPKSLDVSKAIDKQAGRIGESVVALKRELIALFDASGKTRGQIDAECGFRACNYLTLPKDGKRPDPWVNVLPTAEKWATIKRVLGAEGSTADHLDALFSEAEREVVATGYRVRRESTVQIAGPSDGEYPITAPATDAARQWEGWGTALKPAWEPIIVARKPLVGTVAANVLKHGTGGLNIGGCRIEAPGGLTKGGAHTGASPNPMNRDAGLTESRPRAEEHPAGRWPANVVLDEEAGALLDEQAGIIPPSYRKSRTTDPAGSTWALGRTDGQSFGHHDTGGASRFFYCAKASKKDRNRGLKCRCIREWEQEAQRVATRAARATQPARATTESTMTDDSEWPMMSSGSATTDPSLTDTRSTTRTTTNKTTDPKTSSLSTPSPTSACTEDANCETDSGGNHAESVASPSPSRPIIGTSTVRGTPSMDGADRATSKEPSIISDENGRCIRCGEYARSVHPTVKPISLMSWLVRLVTPPNGLVLDPFMGSASTGLAALDEGFRFIGIEQDEHNHELCVARLSSVA